MFCKYCGYEYQGDGNEPRFCPNCGKSFIVNNERFDSDTNEEIKADKALEEVAAATESAPQNNTTDSSNSFWSKFEEAFTRLAAYFVVGGLCVALVFAAAEKITGHPIQDKIVGVKRAVGQPMYKKSVKQLKRGLRFLDFETEGYERKYVSHDGMNEFVNAGEDGNDEEINISCDSYIVTIPTTIHFGLIGDQEINIKMLVTEFDEEDNSSKAVKRFGKSATLYKHLWSPEDRFGINDSLDELMSLILKEAQAYYDNDQGVIPAQYEDYCYYYLEYFFAVMLGSLRDMSETDPEYIQLEKFLDYFFDNAIEYSKDYPLLFKDFKY